MPVDTHAVAPEFPPSQKSSQPKVGCLFSGMGGFASGMLKAGYSVMWANDVNKYACQVFRHRLPDVRLLEKCVSELCAQKDELEPVDVLTGGFPCQPFSVAGNRRGFEDVRSETFGEMLRVASSLTPKPKCLILENVPPVKLWKDVIWFEFKKIGYHFDESNFWSVNVKDSTGVPQDRNRVFMFAFSMTDFPQNPFAPPPPQSHPASATQRVRRRQQEG